MQMFAITHDRHDTAVLTPAGDLGTLECHEYRDELEDTLEMLRTDSARHVVVDLQYGYFGLSAPRFITRIHEVARQRDGQLALCRVSPVGLKVLELSRVDPQLPVCTTLAEAIRTVREQRTPPVVRTEAAKEDCRKGQAILEVERVGNVMVLTPRRELGSQDRSQLARELDAVHAELDGALATDILLDFHRTKFFGCTGVAYFLLRLWSAAERSGGRMAFCNLSSYEQEVLRIARLDQLWPNYASRIAALRQLRAQPSRTDTSA